MLECSVAGVSLAESACHSLVLGAMQRGEDHPATLVLSSPENEEAYEVTIRLAARGPAHVEFALVTLPAPARHLLGAQGPIRAPDREAPYRGSREKPDAPPHRRLMLSLSAAVAEITRRRRSQNAPPEAPSVAPSEVTASDDAAVPLSVILVAIAGLIALATLLGTLLFG